MDGRGWGRSWDEERCGKTLVLTIGCWNMIGAPNTLGMVPGRDGLLSANSTVKPAKRDLSLFTLKLLPDEAVIGDVRPDRLDCLTEANASALALLALVLVCLEPLVLRFRTAERAVNDRERWAGA